MEVKFGSLFSGFGGMDLGLERAGMECAWQVENDSYAVRVLEKHWPDVKRYEDIREVDFGRVERVDLIAGGFPCQDLSYAGAGRGISGPNSGLWTHFKDAICIVRPRYVLVENVSALLGRGMGAVLGDLAALGYDARWESMRASAFGAAHYRERLFIVAYPRGERFVWGAQQVRGENGYEGGQGQGARWHHPHGCLDRTRSERQICRQTEYGEGFWACEPDVGRMVHGIPSRVERLRGLGNSVVPQIAEYIGRVICENAHIQQKVSTS